MVTKSVIFQKQKQGSLQHSRSKLQALVTDLYKNIFGISLRKIYLWVLEVDMVRKKGGFLNYISIKILGRQIESEKRKISMKNVAWYWRVPYIYIYIYIYNTLYFFNSKIWNFLKQERVALQVGAKGNNFLQVVTSFNYRNHQVASRKQKATGIMKQIASNR